jgi:hypothetical protein
MFSGLLWSARDNDKEEGAIPTKDIAAAATSTTTVAATPSLNSGVATAAGHRALEMDPYRSVPAKHCDPIPPFATPPPISTIMPAATTKPPQQRPEPYPGWDERAAYWNSDAGKAETLRHLQAGATAPGQRMPDPATTSDEDQAEVVSSYHC